MSSIICLGNHGSGDNNQIQVAELMKFLINKYNCKLVLGLGNNILPNGVKSPYDDQFDEKFKNPYSFLPKNIKFYNILGNHDYGLKKSSKSQINYSRLNKKWVLPHNFYCFKKIINKIPVEFMAIDTNFDKMNKNNKNLQEKWLVNTLYDSNARWNILFSHHPWKNFGNAENCNDELDIFYNKISNTKKVDLIISSHDNSQQHIVIPNKPNMIISGVGGKYIDEKNPKIKIDKELKYFSKNLGCVLIEFHKQFLKIKFYNVKKENEYNFHIHKI